MSGAKLPAKSKMQVREGDTSITVRLSNDLEKRQADAREAVSTLMETAKLIAITNDIVPIRAPQRTIVCLCGSTRFWQTFQDVNLAETLAGRIVLSIGAAVATDDKHFGHLTQEAYDRTKADLDALHMDKIALADEVFIINAGGYMGPSTTREWAHAVSLGKKVRWLRSPQPTWTCRGCGCELGAWVRGKNPHAPIPCLKCGEILSPGAKHPPGDPPEFGDGGLRLLAEEPRTGASWTDSLPPAPIHESDPRIQAVREARQKASGR